MRLRGVAVLLALSLLVNLGLAVWLVRLSGEVNSAHRAPVQEAAAALAVADETLHLADLSGEALEPLYLALHNLDAQLALLAAVDRRIAPLSARLQQEVLRPVSMLHGRNGLLTTGERNVLLQARQKLAEIGAALP